MYSSHRSVTEKDETRVAAGLKAAVHNPHVSEEAKERSAERLHDMGTDPEETSRSTRRSGGTTTSKSLLEFHYHR